jgi:hypothetical protein
LNAYFSLLSCSKFFSRKQEPVLQKSYVYICVSSQKRAMTISVEQREDELTTKGSDRILVSKTRDYPTRYR